MISRIQKNFFGPIACPVWCLLKEVLLYLNHVYREILKSIPHLTEKRSYLAPPETLSGPLIGKSRRKNIRNRYTFFRRIITFFFVRLVALDFLQKMSLDYELVCTLFVLHLVKRSNQYSLDSV